jgi:uncharacterized protein DUF4175
MNEHDELRALLAEIRRRWFALTALESFARAAVMAALPILLAAGVAGVIGAKGWSLVGLMAVAGIAAVAVVVRVFRRMPLRPDDRHVARFVEERTDAPALSDTLVSAVQVIESPDRYGSGFAAPLVSRAVHALRDVDPSALIPREDLRRMGVRAAAGAGLILVALVLAAPHLLRAGATVWVSLFPRTISIDVATGNARVAAGRPIRIAAKLQGRGAGLLSLTPALVVTANGQQRSVPMSASGDGFSYTIESVDRSFEYRVVAGGSSSRAYSVTALFPPRVKSIDLAYEYPAFTGLKSREEKNGGDIYAPEGTRVRLQVHADKPLASAELAMTGSKPVTLQASGPSASAEIVLADDGAYRVRLSDADGLGSIGDVEYFIRVMDDRPPTVQVVRPTGDQGITPLQEVAIEARADDDYGISGLDLVYAVGGRPAKTIPFTRVAGTDVARIGTHVLAAEDLKVQPGDVITYYAQARDVARGKRSTEARSDMFFLEVKPFNEEFVSAQSQAMGGGAPATQIDTLIAAQKEIINATWNLERRSGAGRSADDVKSVAGAQAELKTRAEQMSGSRRGGRGFIPQQIAPPRGTARGGPDPVASAIDAMGRAVEQLEGARTADAIPHEMEALQGLLRAQAEIRRRQVMQQSASAAGQGGTSRTDRDLSALFDRELQRQQKTNYETPQQSTDTAQQNEGDLLDQIRELARRQDELAQQQRQLATANPDADELKRQLERLNREQEELRRRAEQLQKQVQTSALASGRGRGSSSQSASDMQRAAEQMRSAAAEMQRQNASGAAASAEQAAEALKRLERQVRGSSADGRQRTAGELRLEAQQIAEGQRRAAAEAARLDKERSAGDRATSDALRRLAAEKDKLAERIDRLQQAARDAERDAPGAEAAPFREAGQQLQGQQVGTRMRDSARELRDRASGTPEGRQGGAPGQGAPGTPASAAQREQQLTRALEGVANALNGGGQKDGRKLAEQLDRTREMRDRLNALEQQLRSAEAQAGRGRDGSGQRDGHGQRAANGQRDGAAGRAGGRGGEQSGEGRGSSAAGTDAVQRARQEYLRELQRANEALGRMRAEQWGGGGSTPEEHEFSRSAPGNEAFKQDFSNWDSLRKNVDLALEQFEAAASDRLAPRNADRLSAGGSERIPDAYRPLVSRYFEAIAKAKK